LLAHFTETLEVYTDRFVFRQGIFAKREDVVFFMHITNYSTRQSILDRIFGVANYSIETAAHTAVPELELRGYTYRLREFLSKMLQAYTAAD
jgi:uncharacterized membrane protein YdbT with pleckstrin-like domain